jgi:D-alanine-D-alanine ligase
MRKKQQIGLFTGGYSAEREVALKSAAYVQKYLNSKVYDLHTIDVQRERWTCGTEGYFDLNLGALILGERQIALDAAYVMIHGQPAEDGLIQGYFDMVGLPYTCCSVFTSALTFDKQATKHFLRGLVPMAPSCCLRAEDSLDYASIADWGFPLFVKPNKQGSSFGITKVKRLEELEPAIEKARTYDDEVMVEKCITGREFSCGVVATESGIRALPLTEIKPFNEFFDFAAKYEKQSEEITPAQLPRESSEKAQDLARRIYHSLHCDGLVRVDFILQEDEFYFLELNTIPGMSAESIVPQQAAADHIAPEQFVEWPLKACLAQASRHIPTSSIL